MDLVQQGNTYTDDNLFLSADIPTMTTGVELLNGQGILKRGTILTIDTNKKYILITSSSEDVAGVLTDDVDTDVETVATIYRQGHFNKDALIYGSTITNIDELEKKLLEANIITNTAIK